MKSDNELILEAYSKQQLLYEFWPAVGVAGMWAWRTALWVSRFLAKHAVKIGLAAGTYEATKDIGKGAKESMTTATKNLTGNIWMQIAISLVPVIMSVGIPYLIKLFHSSDNVSEMKEKTDDSRMKQFLKKINDLDVSEEDKMKFISMIIDNENEIRDIIEQNT